MNKKTFLNFLKWTVVVLTVIILNFLFHYAIAGIYKPPVLAQFCPAQPTYYNDAQSCVSNGGQWTNYNLTPTEITANIQSGQAIGTCDPDFTCRNNFVAAQIVHNKNAFIALLVLGLIAIGAGIAIKIESLSMGFEWAGIISLFVASFEYWYDIGSLLRAIVLVLALVFLILISVKTFRRSKKLDGIHGSK